MRGVVSAALGLLWIGAAQAQSLRTAGTLLVDVSAETLSANDGAPVVLWPNAGSLGGAFSALAGNTGASFTNSLLGKKAVLFAGTGQSVLTNAPAPASLTGSSPCSAEAWVWVPALPAPKSVYLAWTQDEGAAGWQAETRMMLRYDSGNVAIDHRGSAVGFGYGTPAAGAWHHIAVTRSFYGIEALYVDGNLSATYAGATSLEAGQPLTLGAVLRYGGATYTNFFAGALSRVRLHSGTLSEQDVRHNFLADAWGYNAAGAAVWTGGSGDWGDASGWAGGNVAGAGEPARVLSGQLEVTNNATPSPLLALDVVAGAVSLTQSASRLDAKTPFVLGRDSANPASLAVRGGSVTVASGAGPAVLDLAMSGAESSLSLGGGAASAALYASQLRVFAGAGAADVWVASNGVLELDALVSESPAALSLRFDGGTLRNRTGSTQGYLFNIPQVRIGAGGVTFDAVTNTTLAVSAALLHDGNGPSVDGGLRKIGPGTLLLSGTNGYAGDTSVEAGTLALAPRLLDGLVYRLDASTHALSTLQLDGSSNVVAWADAAGSGLLFTTNKAERSPVYDPALFGGRGGLRFSRDTTSYRLAANRTNRVQSLFAVIAPASGNSLGGLWGQSEGDYGIRLNAGSVQYAGNANDFASTGWVYTNGALGNAFTLGQPVVVSAISSSAKTWQTAIGDYWANATYRRVYKGDIAEVLAYDRRLDDLERGAVEAYLKAKWLGAGAELMTAPCVLPSNTVLSVRAGAAVELGGSSAHLAALAGAGCVGNRNALTARLTLGARDTSSVYAGAITGNVAVNKTGLGRVTLSGPNAFTEPLIIEGGTLQVVSGVPVITGLVYRLDASRTNTMTFLPDGTNVAVWADAEGSGFTFAATNDLHCPSYDPALFAGRGGLRFGLGARRRMLGTTATHAQTVFAVALIRDASNDNGGLWGKDAEDLGLRIGGTTWYFPGNNNDFHFGEAGGFVCVNGAVSNASVSVGQPHLVTSVSGAARTFRPAIGDYWGSAQWTGRYFRGEVAELLVFDRRLTDLERQTVEAALMAKWFPTSAGAVLPSSAAVTVAAGATLDLSGGSLLIRSLDGGGSVTNGHLAVTGAVAPDGRLSLPGAPSLSGTLELDIPEAGAGDTLAVGGPLDLGGLALSLTLPPGRPIATVHTLATAAGGIAGRFESVSLPGPWRLVYEPTSVRLVYSVGVLIQLQ